MNQLILGKGLLACIKGHLCLTEGHLDNPKGQVKVESPLIRTCF